MSRDTMQTEKVLDHILEIIYLMTGEEYMIMKKPMEYRCIPRVSADLCRTRNSIVEISSESEIHLRGGSASYTPQLHHGLTTQADSVIQGPAAGGHVQIKCDDVAMYLSVEEWEYLEKHKDQFTDVTRNTPPPHAETLIHSQDGAETSMDNMQYETQTSHNSRAGDQTPLSSLGEAQTPIGSLGGAQTSLNALEGVQTSLSSLGETQIPLGSSGGAQTSLNILGEAQMQLSSLGGARTPLSSLGGAKTQVISLGEAQALHSALRGVQMVEAQTPLNSLEETQIPLSSLRRDKNPLNSPRGAQTQPNTLGGDQNPLNSLRGTQTPLNILGGDQNPLNSPRGAQTQPNTLGGDHNPLNSLRGAQTTLNTLGGDQNPLNSLRGAQTPLNTLGGDQNPLNSPRGAQTQPNSLGGNQTLPSSLEDTQTLFSPLGGPLTELNSSEGSQISCEFGATNPFRSLYSDQISCYSHNKSSVTTQNVLRQGQTDSNRAQNCPDLPGTPETITLQKPHFPQCLSKCEADNKESALKKFTNNPNSSNTPELPPLNASPGLTICEKTEQLLAGDGSFVENLTEDDHLKFSPFDPNQGRQNPSRYLDTHPGPDDTEKRKNMAWTMTSYGTNETFNRQCSDTLENPPNRTVRQKEVALGLNPSMINNPHLHYEPLSCLLAETQIKKELTNREYEDSIGGPQTMMVEETDATQSLNQHSSLLGDGRSLNVLLQTPIKKEASTPLDPPYFVKVLKKKTFHGSIRPRACVNALNPVTCSECGKAFSCNAYLIRHQRIHTGVKPYTCSECGRSFTWFSSFVTHKRTHTGEKPFSCTECGKRFQDYSGINKHLRVHTGEKPFSCAICQERFAQTYQLAKHQFVHFGQNVVANT